MFERFTERARQVIVLAQAEANRHAHEHIGTEHLLIGLLREEEGLACLVLERKGATVERARQLLVSAKGTIEDDQALTADQRERVSKQVPFTPRAKKVLELALREALGIGHNYIGTEHLLLGLVREADGLGARMLIDMNIDMIELRDEVMKELSGGRSAVPVTTSTTSPSSPSQEEKDQDVIERVARIEAMLPGLLATPQARKARLEQALKILDGEVTLALDNEELDTAQELRAAARRLTQLIDSITDSLES